MTFKEIADKTVAVLDYSVLTFADYKITVLMLFSAVLTIFITWLILRSIKRLLRIARAKKRLSIGQEFAYYQLSKYLIIIIAIALLFEVFDRSIVVLLAGSVALLVGVGMGLQRLFNDIVSGFFLLMENTVRVDDIVEVDGIICKVKEIGVRTSKVVTRDGISVVIPNSKIVENNVHNWTINSLSTRFSVAVGVAYGSDVNLVKKILLECAERHKEVSKNPRSFCRFSDFGDSALEFELFFWSQYLFRIEDVQSDLRFMIQSEFRKHNIKIPFPQREIHVNKGESFPDPDKDSFRI
jgi:small-conductance mechanosensitive channel